MAEYIEREAAKRKYCETCNWYGTDLCNGCETPMSRIPIADVAPVRRGHYHKRCYYREATKSYDIEMKVCSECVAEWSFDAETGVSDYNYCPNCGAKMEASE